MKKLALLSLVLLFSMCKSTVTIFAPKEVAIEEKIAEILGMSEKAA